MLPELQCRPTRVHACLRAFFQPTRLALAQRPPAAPALSARGQADAKTAMGIAHCSKQHRQGHPGMHVRERRSHGGRRASGSQAGALGGSTWLHWSAPAGLARFDVVRVRVRLRRLLRHTARPAARAPPKPTSCFRTHSRWAPTCRACRARRRGAGRALDRACSRASLLSRLSALAPLCLRLVVAAQHAHIKAQGRPRAQQLSEQEARTAAADASSSVL